MSWNIKNSTTSEIFWSRYAASTSCTKMVSNLLTLNTPLIYTISSIWTPIASVKINTLGLFQKTSWGWTCISKTLPLNNWEAGTATRTYQAGKRSTRHHFLNNSTTCFHKGLSDLQLIANYRQMLMKTWLIASPISWRTTLKLLMLGSKDCCESTKETYVNTL